MVPIEPNFDGDVVVELDVLLTKGELFTTSLLLLLKGDDDDDNVPTVDFGWYDDEEENGLEDTVDGLSLLNGDVLFFVSFLKQPLFSFVVDVDVAAGLYDDTIPFGTVLFPLPVLLLKGDEEDDGNVDLNGVAAGLSLNDDIDDDENFDDGVVVALIEELPVVF